MRVDEMPVRNLVPVAAFLLKGHLNWDDSSRVRQPTAEARRAPAHRIALLLPWIGEQWLTAGCPIEKLHDAHPVRCDAIEHFRRNTSVIVHSSDLEERLWHAKAALSDTCHSQALLPQLSPHRGRQHRLDRTRYTNSLSLSVSCPHHPPRSWKSLSR